MPVRQVAPCICSRCCWLQVDGVYDSDPAQNPDARMYEQLCYQEVTASGLQVTSAAWIVHE